MAKTISTLAVDLTANTAKFQSEMTKGSKRVKTFGDELIAVTKIASGTVAALGAGMAAGLKLIADEMDNAAHSANKLGLTTEALTSLRHAVEQTSEMTGTQFDTALQRMTRRLAEAAQGTGEARNALAELGLDAQKLNAMSPDQAFKAIADQMSQVGSQSDRVRLAFKLFDTEGVALVNTLAIGASGIQELQQQAVDLGVAFDDKAAASAQRFNDNLDVLGKTFKGAMNNIATDSGAMEAAATLSNDLAVALKSLVDTGTQVSSTSEEFIAVGRVVIDTLYGMVRGTQMLVEHHRIMYSALYSMWTLDWEGLKKNGSEWVAIFNDADKPVAKLNKELSETNRLMSDGALFPNLAAEFRAINGYDPHATGINIGAKAPKAPKAPTKPKAVKGEDWRSMLDSQTSGFGEDPFATPSATGDLGSMLDEQTGLFDQDIANSKNQIQTLESLYAEGLDRERMFRDERLVMVQDALDREAVSVERAAKLKSQIEQDYQDAQLSTASEGFGMIANLMNTNSKEMFEIGKKAAIVQTTIDTYQMATSAYKAMAGIPFIGPALGAAAAASAVAFGLAQVSSINSQQFTPSAEGGFDIPAGVNPVTQLHEKEMVLPKAQAEVIRNLASGKGGAGDRVVVHNYSGETATAKVLDDGTIQVIVGVASQVAEQNITRGIMDGTSSVGTAFELAYGIHR